MRPENSRMAQFLADNGLPGVRVKYISDGSLKGRWRLYKPNTPWVGTDLPNRLTALGFTDFDGRPLTDYSGNGGVFSVFVRGHNELL